MQHIKLMPLSLVKIQLKSPISLQVSLQEDKMCDQCITTQNFCYMLFHFVHRNLQNQLDIFYLDIIFTPFIEKRLLSKVQSCN